MRGAAALAVRLAALAVRLAALTLLAHRLLAVLAVVACKRHFILLDEILIYAKCLRIRAKSWAC